MIDKKTLLNNIKQDLDDAKNSKTEIENKITKWRKYYNAEPLGNEVDGKSKYISKDIKKLLKWQLPIIMEPFVNTPEIVRCQGTTAQTVKTEKVKEKLLNYWFCRNFDRYNFMKKALKISQKESICVVQTGWNYKTETQVVEQQIQQPDGSIIMQEIKQEIPIINEPTAKIIKFENVFIDPRCDGEDPEFVIIRYETTISNLKENIHWFNEDAIKKLEEKQLQDNTDDVQSDSSLYDEREARSEEYGKDVDFSTTDKSRTKIMVYEYWGKYDVNEDGIAENIVCAWCDDVILKLEDNPYPDNEIPFVIFNYDVEPFQIVGDSAVEDLYDKSHLITITTRGLIENLASANAGQIGIARGALDQENMDRFFKGRNFIFNKNFASEIWKNDYNNVGALPLQMLEMFQNENESLSGVTKTAIGQPSKVLSATQSSQMENATQRRMSDLVRNVAENLIKPILRKWLAYSAEFLNEQEVFYITGEEQFVVDRKDLQGKVHMIMQTTTQATDEQKAQQLSFLLQTSQQNQDPNITKMLYTKLLKLNKMYEEAKELEEYKPQPDPMRQQMQQLELAKAQLEIKKLQAEIMRIQSDAGLKQSKAKHTESEADLKDLDFLDKINENPHKRELDKLGMMGFINKNKGE